jgi:hypothetical protein
LGRSALLVTNRRTLVLAAAAVVAVKLVWFALDRTPLFYMGDSRAYIGSALGWSVLTDRSNTYGWLIRAFAVAPGSLTPLLLAQALAGAATAWLLTVVLLRFFQVRPAIAIAAGVALAAEPLQILYERMVLTESFSLLVLAGYLSLALSYLRRPRLVLLVAIAAAGVALLSLRLVYVPVTLFNAALIPLLAWARPARGWPSWTGMKPLLTHLSVSLVATLALHQGYRIALGHAAKLPPGYQYANGFFLAGSWAPVIEPEDATDPRAREVVEALLAGGRYPLRNLEARADQIWQPGGLKSELIRAFGGDRYSANQAAQRMCMGALRRDPLSVARIVAFNYTYFWRRLSTVQSRLLIDQGGMEGPDPPFLDRLRNGFNLDPGWSHAAMSPSKRYHRLGVLWYCVLAVSPLISLLGIFASAGEARRGALLLFITNGLLLLIPSVVLVGAGVVRSLHPLSFGTLAAAGVLANRVVRPVRSPSPS